jgi:hypothetical protein
VGAECERVWLWRWHIPVDWGLEERKRCWGLTLIRLLRVVPCGSLSDEGLVLGIQRSISFLQKGNHRRRAIHLGCPGFGER